jgi:hypothetical protein
MLHTEKSCSKRHTKYFKWSPALIQCIETVRYWRLLLKRSKGLLIRPSTILRAKESAHLLIEHDIEDQPLIIHNLQGALQSLRYAQKTHVELREAYLSGLAEAIFLERKPYLAKKENSELLHELTADQVQKLILRERDRNMYRSIKKVLKGTNLGGIQRINIPASQEMEPFPVRPDPKTWTGSWRSIMDPDLIVKRICSANVCQYNLAYCTPFGSGALAETIGHPADTPVTQSLLEGIIPSSLEAPLPETQQMLANLSRPLPLTSQTIFLEITPDQFCATYKVVQETPLLLSLGGTLVIIKLLSKTLFSVAFMQK